MALILNIETATKSCSVSIGKDGKLVALKEIQEEKFSHAEKLHLFIKEVIDEADVTLNDLDAIAVSKGPGSYTGLRIGVSSAKGLAYGLDIPLIATSTLATLTIPEISSDDGYSFYCPLIDARRMEVYTAVFDNEMKQLEPVKAIIMDDQFRLNYLDQGKVLFFGDGALKFQEIVNHENAHFSSSKYPSSANMVSLSERSFSTSKFEDRAYFEPFYLKDL